MTLFFTVLIVIGTIPSVEPRISMEQIEIEHQVSKWVAKSIATGRVLWSLPYSGLDGPIWPPILDHANQRIILRMPLGKITCLTPAGRVVWRKDFPAAFDPRPLIRVGPTLIMKQGTFIRPNPVTLSYLSQAEKATAIDIRTGNRRWIKPEVEVGTPFAANGSKAFLSIRTLNPVEIANSGAPPQLLLESRSARDGRMAWKLQIPSGATDAALDLLDAISSWRRVAAVVQVSANPVSIEWMEGTGSSPTARAKLTVYPKLRRAWIRFGTQTWRLESDLKE